MTQVLSNGIVIIAPENAKECMQCHKKAECRPYGPDYTDICFECGMKDEEVTKKRMAFKLFGDH